MNISRRLNEETIWLLFLCLAAFFINNSSLPTDIMETRNIVTAREIVADGNWLVPTMNGVLRIEKPPLPTWIAAVVETLNPRDLSTQRSAAGLAACMWTMFLYFVGKYTTRRRDYAFISTLVFITCYNVILMGRSATWDIYCHAFMMGGIYYLMRLLYDDRYYAHSHKWRWGLLAGVFMGLSFMSKGPVSFYALLLPFLIAMLYSVRPTMRGKGGPLALLIILTLVLSSWWYIVLWITHPEMLHYVLNKETGAWSNHNVRPWYYYWRFFSEMGAWALLTLAALIVPYWKKRVPQSRQYTAAVVMLVSSFVLLSLMPEKKMRYLLPMCVPVAYSVAHILLYYKDRHVWDRFADLLFKINGTIVALVIVAMPVLIHLFVYGRGIIDHGTAIFVDVLCLAVLWYLIRSMRLHKIIDMVNSVAILFLIAECFMIKSIGMAFGNPDKHSIHEVVKQENVKHLPFYHPASEDLRIEMVYQAGRKILPVDVNNLNDIASKAPCVLVTREPLSQAIPAKVLAHLDTIKVAQCDDNVHPKSNKHYSRQFLNQISIVKVKK